MNHFKLFLLDVGLMGHIAGVTGRSVILSDAFQFKGQLTENYVLQQLIPLGEHAPAYFSYAQNREIDFLVQQDEQIVPIEVKAGTDKKAVSFKSYIEKYRPHVVVRLSANEYLQNGAITNIPLYFAGKTFELVSGMLR